MRAVILAGGKGTRLSAGHPNIPKSLIPIGDRPLIAHQLQNLKENHMDEIFLIVGHLHEQIMAYVGDGAKFGVKAEYIVEETPLGTAGGLYNLKHIVDDDFLLIFGDILFNVDMGRFIRFHQSKKAFMTLFTHPNDHPSDSALIDVSPDGQVNQFIGKNYRPRYYKNMTNAGLHILSPKALDLIEAPGVYDLDTDIIRKASLTEKIYAYHSSEYVKDMGTPERLKKVREDFEKGIVFQKNLKNQQRCVFLDRDGTINKLNGFIQSPDEFEILPGVYDAVRKINESGYLCIVITNQPVIARGECTEKGLLEIHKKLETLLGEKGCYIDALYYCPHHPDKGFAGEIPALKIECHCRKPKTSLFEQAAADFNIDFSKSFMIGDMDRDILAGKALHMKTAKIGAKENVDADFYGQDILSCLQMVLK